MKSLLIIGAGQFGKLVYEIAELCGYEKIGFLDDNSEIAVGKIDAYKSFQQEYEEFIVAIGNPDVRKHVMEMLETVYHPATLIHPKAIVSRSAGLGAGVIIEAGAVINTEATVAKGCIINAGAVVNHNSTVSEYVQVDCNAVVAAGAIVEAKTKVESCTVVHRSV